MNDDRIYRIIDLYDKLNDKDKQKMLEWAEVLHDSNKYKPHNILYFQDYIKQQKKPLIL